ncbi:MAG: hypothetical protein ACKOFE_00955, partial [Bacteroidota bacterium]
MKWFTKSTSSSLESNTKSNTSSKPSSAASSRSSSFDAQSVIRFDRSGYSDEELLELYQAILLPRMIEEKMLILLRQGKVSKWFSGIGQEAIAVGCTKALRAEEFIFPLHR